MKKMTVIMSLYVLMNVPGAYAGSYLFKQFADDDIVAPLGASLADEKQEVLKHLQEELDAFVAESAIKEDEDKKALDRISQTIDALEVESVSPQQKEFVNKKLSILNEIHQLILNVQFARKQEISALEKNISLLQEYIKDPDFKPFSIEVKSFYTIGDLQNASKRVMDQEEVIKHLKAQKSDTASDLENKKRKLAALEKEYKLKKKEQQEFATKAADSDEQEPQDLSFKERGQLIDLELELAEWSKKLAKQNVNVTSRDVALLETSIFTEVEKLNKLKNNFEKVRISLRMDDSDIRSSKEALEKEKRESLAERETYYREIKQLNNRKEALKKDLENLGKKYKISTADVRELAEWGFDAKSADEFVQYAEMSYRAELIVLIDLQIELLRAKIDLSASEFARSERKHEIKVSWYKLTQRRYKDNDELVGEIKKYKDVLAEAERDIVSFTDKRNAATSGLNVYNNALENVKKMRENLSTNSQEFFVNSERAQDRVQERLNQAEQVITKLIDISGKLIEINSQRISVVNGYIKDIQGIVAELETKSMWQRSAGAITWRGITNIIPDLNYFVADVRALGVSYISQISWNSTAATIKSLFMNLGNFVMFLFYVLLFFALSWLFKTRTEPLIEYLLKGTHAYGGLAFISKMLAIIISFISSHFTGLYIWTLLLWFVYTDVIAELFPSIIFYLGSIVYLVYLIPQFVQYVIDKNREYEYALFSESFERRFRWVFSIFAYVTVVLLLFREAFILATIHTSELPDILLAFYSIITRTLVIFSIGKEEVLGLIPQRPAIWQWVSAFIEKYYYLLIAAVIVLMIMSDPNVGGYGNLVSYAMWGTIGSALLLWGMYVAQIYLKRLSSTIFFSTEEETLKERFTNAKTWYGLFTIASFVLLGIVTFIIGAKIWGVTTIFDHMTGWLDYKLWSTGRLDPSGKGYIWFTPSKFFVLLAFVIAGFIIASAIERFVLQRIFNLLLIDTGVQNTVSSITRYITIFLFILIGFLWAHLDNILIAFGLVIGAVGWMVKEPLSDFVSYFIILVQRPVQIGDYIVLNEDVQGVVRQITPRSVILRRKDSFTVIVPNSFFISQPVNNWHYARNFVAFDDIRFSIPYSANPEKVKEIIAHVLDQSINVLKSPKPIIRLEQFGDNGFVFMVRGFVTGKNILHKWEIASDIRLNITKSLYEAGIRLAVPTREIVIDRKDIAQIRDDGSRG